MRGQNYKNDMAVQKAMFSWLQGGWTDCYCKKFFKLMQHWKKCKYCYDERLKVFMAVNSWVKVFRVVMLFSVALGQQCFRGFCCLHLQGEVNMKAARSSETLAPYCNTTKHNNSEDLGLRCTVLIILWKLYFHTCRPTFVSLYTKYAHYFWYDLHYYTYT